MKGLKFICIPLVLAVTSMFFFPFEFNALPELNTKKMMAAAALVILLWNLLQKRELKMDKDFMYLSIVAGLVSVCGIIAVTYNNTEDYTYATYISSFWVWWGGAYTSCSIIRWVHGEVTIGLIIKYLVVVCILQCCLALAIDSNVAFKKWVMSIFATGDGYFAKGNVQRMFGIGCSLDVAGSRFSAVLVMMIYAFTRNNEIKRWYTYLGFFAAFFFISFVGNMIARTTLIGLLVGFAYLGFVSLRQIKHLERRYFLLWRWFIIILLIGIPIVVSIYQTDARMRKNIRFGFEGFFSLVEKGHWEVSSNETLKSMYVWPDNAKTWIIGDAYFNNPVMIDPYYTGEITEGYYKNTDVGYLRFIFYFGVVGLLMFSFFFIEVGRTCMRHFPEWKVMFLMLLAVHFIVWAKVSTDIFLAFAPFLCFEDNIDENCLSDSRNV